MNADCYRENIREARGELRVAQERFERLKRAELIFWGTIRLKSGSEYTGWLVKGEDADKAFTEVKRTESNLMHWLRLLAEEEQKALDAVPREPVRITEAEKQAALERITAALAARFAEAEGEVYNPPPRAYVDADGPDAA